jgi:hypothetical protein
MDCARTVLAGPYRPPLAPRSVLPGFTRTMAPRSIRQASKTGQHNGINEPKAAESKPHGPCGSRAVYRGIRARHRIAAAFVARASLPLGAGAESSDCRRMEHGKPCACVLPQLTSSGESCKFVAAARENLAVRRGQAIATHTARQRTSKF